MAENKRKSGYAILKAKLSKSEAELEAAQKQLKAAKLEKEAMEREISTLHNKVKVLKEDRDVAVMNMGWLRRKIFGY